MKKKIILTLLSALIISLLILGCRQSVQDVDKEVQESVLARAQAAVPAYQIDNFLSRKAVNEWLSRVDTSDKLWYVYVMADTGAFIGYYISRTIPLSYGVSITNPQQALVEFAGDPVLPAPGLDGVFYTGVDKTAWYFFDAETDALITTNMRMTFLDRPLDIDVPLLKIKVEK